jgi:hypothetical protein
MHRMTVSLLFDPGFSAIHTLHIKDLDASEMGSNNAQETEQYIIL